MSYPAVSRIFARFDDKRSLYMPEDPVMAGGRNGSYIFERQKLFSAGHAPTHAFDEHIFMLPVGEAAVPFTSRLNGRRAQGYIEPGRFRFVAAGDTLSTTWESPLEGIFLTLHPSLLDQALGEEAYDPQTELVSNIMPHEDPLLAHLTLAMQSYLQAGRMAGKIFEQSLLTAIAAHLITAYGRGTRGRHRTTPLTRQKRARAEDYVRQNLGRDISLVDIAAVVELSPHQLGRTFRAATGQSLWQFVIECRAREAMRMMTRNRTLSLSYIARACGFESYSQFIAAFRKVFGQLPSEYRRTRGI
jgi:AraC family transcriptional regulator